MADKKFSSYCEFARNSVGVHKIHHDTEHGIAPLDDDDLFRRLMLEVSQAGLSFDIVLKKKDGIYKAFNKIDKVAKFNEKDIERLMQDSGIVRNRLKILAAIYNAQKIKHLQKTHGSFRAWLDMHHPRTKDEWVALFKKDFKFTGGEIINEFMMSIGYLPGAHDKNCYMMKKTKPKFLVKKK
jgi:DNA-3-methyladenine glycosylase I